MRGTPKVALLIETAREYGRGLLRGIVRYSRLHGPWAFYVTPGDFEQALPKMEQWGGTGIIARIATAKVARAVLATRLPLVALDLSPEQMAPDNPLSSVSRIRSGSQGAGAMAAEHLLERGFRNFAFVGIARRIWSDLRQQAFENRLADVGQACENYKPPRLKRDREWGREQSIMAEWIRTLPKPVGLLACNDDRGREVLEACKAAAVQVPEEVAVVGMDNDDLLCDLTDPPLSSVAFNTERGGYEAAAHLDALMRRRSTKARELVVKPLRVVTRQSSDVVAIEDCEVAAALRFIRQKAGDPIQVGDVLRQLKVSRRALEIRFQKGIGRSIHAEIQRVHVERAKRLLMETDLPMPKIADACGFGSASYMGMVLLRQLGMTPAQFRTDVRSR